MGNCATKPKADEGDAPLPAPPPESLINQPRDVDVVKDYSDIDKKKKNDKGKEVVVDGEIEKPRSLSHLFQEEEANVRKESKSGYQAAAAAAPPAAAAPTAPAAAPAAAAAPPTAPAAPAAAVALDEVKEKVPETGNPLAEQKLSETEKQLELQQKLPEIGNITADTLTQEAPEVQNQTTSTTTENVVFVDAAEGVVEPQKEVNQTQAKDIKLESAGDIKLESAGGTTTTQTEKTEDVITKQAE